MALLSGQITQSVGHFMRDAAWVHLLRGAGLPEALGKNRSSMVELLYTKHASSAPAAGTMNRLAIDAATDGALPEHEVRARTGVCYAAVVQKHDTGLAGDELPLLAFRRAALRRCGLPSTAGRGSSKLVLSLHATGKGSHVRALANQPELERSLREWAAVAGAPLEVVHFGQMRPCQQVAAVASARVLLGVHGADLAHALWLPRGGVLLEIFPVGAVPLRLPAPLPLHDADVCSVARQPGYWQSGSPPRKQPSPMWEEAKAIERRILSPRLTAARPRCAAPQLAHRSPTTAFGYYASWAVRRNLGYMDLGYEAWSGAAPTVRVSVTRVLAAVHAALTSDGFAADAASRHAAAAVRARAPAAPRFDELNASRWGSGRDAFLRWLSERFESRGGSAAGSGREGRTSTSSASALTRRVLPAAAPTQTHACFADRGCCSRHKRACRAWHERATGGTADQPASAEEHMALAAPAHRGSSAQADDASGLVRVLRCASDGLDDAPPPRSGFHFLATLLGQALLRRKLHAPLEYVHYRCAGTRLPPPSPGVRARFTLLPSAWSSRHKFLRPHMCGGPAWTLSSLPLAVLAFEAPAFETAWFLPGPAATMERADPLRAVRHARVTAAPREPRALSVFQIPWPSAETMNGGVLPHAPPLAQRGALVAFFGAVTSGRGTELVAGVPSPWRTLIGRSPLRTLLKAECAAQAPGVCLTDGAPAKASARKQIESAGSFLLAYRQAVFCLQPPGDVSTRKAFSDAVSCSPTPAAASCRLAS